MLRSLLLGTSGDRYESSGKASDETSRRRAWERIASELQVWHQQQQQQQQQPEVLDAWAIAQDGAGTASTSAERSSAPRTVERSAHSCELEAWRMRHHPAWQDVCVPWVMNDDDDDDESDELADEARRPPEDRTKLSYCNTSQYRGVCRASSGKRWQAQLGNTYIGSFVDEIEAAEAYDKFALQKYGAAKAQLNFPPGRGRKQDDTRDIQNKCKPQPEEKSAVRGDASGSGRRKRLSNRQLKTTESVDQPKLRPVGFRIVKAWSELQPACERLRATVLTMEAKSVLAKKLKEKGGGSGLKWKVCSP